MSHKEKKVVPIIKRDNTYCFKGEFYTIAIMLYLMVCFFNSSCVFRTAFITGVASNRGCVFPFHFELMVDEINKRTTKKVKSLKMPPLLYSV